MRVDRLADDLFVLRGAVNTGVVVSGDRALLIDCCDSVTPETLAGLGVRHVDWVLCTQHRRPNTGGAYRFLEAGASLAAPAAERHLFQDSGAFWADWRNRWHVANVLPPTQVPARPLPAARAVAEGDTVEWQGYEVRVLDTPGMTDGAVSYVVSAGGRTVCFSGDVLYGPGQVWDIYSLQKRFGVIVDYHGFMGNRPRLIASLRKLAAAGADRLVPSHGEAIDDPAAAAGLTIERLDAVWRNYASVSALNFYFPSLLDDTKDDPRRLRPAATHDMPPFVRFVAFTSFAVVSDSGAALLLDCGHDSVVETLHQWLRSGAITSVDGCWITHFHYDHVDALPRLAMSLGCPIMADASQAEVLAHPSRFYLPCISCNPAPIARATADGESWQWREFRLTALHLPGQTLYHGGLLVEGHGAAVLFVGDSFAPTGLDDYCSGNRNFLRRDRGLRHCLDLLRRHRPQYLVNQHQQRAFALSEAAIDYLEATLAEREALLAELLPWPHPDFGADEWWLRAYPYEQEASPGCEVAIDLQMTNHGPRQARALVEPVLPPGWQWLRERSGGEVTLPPRTSGLVQPGAADSDGFARVRLRLPEDAAPGRHVVPFRVTWDGRYLGQVRHALVQVR